jgi:hypothetical protein
MQETGVVVVGKNFKSFVTSRFHRIERRARRKIGGKKTMAPRA